MPLLCGSGRMPHMTELDCKDIKALLSGYIDGELDQPTRHQADRHLAGCASCRGLVEETERLNTLIALDAQRMMWPAGLPAGFEEKVLGQTIYAEAYQFAGHRWTSWLGWVAAAACLLLAASIWFLNLGSASVRDHVATGNRPAPQPRILVHDPVGDEPVKRSWTYDGGLSIESLMSARPSTEQQHVQLIATHETPAIMQAPYTRPVEPAPEPIDEEDAQTLYAASNLLAMLAQADLETFADVERIREIAEYDDLLARLAESRDRLSPQDRPAVLAAEAVLVRVVNGPLSTDDLRSLHNTVASLDLADQIEAISERGARATSLWFGTSGGTQDQEPQMNAH